MNGNFTDFNHVPFALSLSKGERKKRGLL